jgi:hypothetical protein
VGGEARTGRGGDLHDVARGAGELPVRGPPLGEAVLDDRVVGGVQHAHGHVGTPVRGRVGARQPEPHVGVGVEHLRHEVRGEQRVERANPTVVELERHVIDRVAHVVQVVDGGIEEHVGRGETRETPLVQGRRAQVADDGHERRGVGQLAVVVHHDVLDGDGTRQGDHAIHRGTRRLQIPGGLESDVAALAEARQVRLVAPVDGQSRQEAAVDRSQHVDRGGHLGGLVEVAMPRDRGIAEAGTVNEQHQVTANASRVVAGHEGQGGGDPLVGGGSPDASGVLTVGSGAGAVDDGIHRLSQADAGHTDRTARHRRRTVGVDGAELHRPDVGEAVRVELAARRHEAAVGGAVVEPPVPLAGDAVLAVQPDQLHADQITAIGGAQARRTAPCESVTALGREQPAVREAVVGRLDRRVEPEVEELGLGDLELVVGIVDVDVDGTVLDGRTEGVLHVGRLGRAGGEGIRRTAEREQGQEQETDHRNLLVRVADLSDPGRFVI